MGDTDNMPAGRPAGNPYPAGFRPRLLPPLAVLFVGTHLGVGLVLLAGWTLAPAHRPPGWVLLASWTVGAVAAGPLVLLTAGVFVWWYRVRVGPAGLRGHDGWGRPVAVAWAAIGRVRPVAFAGLPCLLVAAPGGRRVWLPLFLRDPDGFAEAVAAFAGADHPLAGALQGRPRAD